MRTSIQLAALASGLLVAACFGSSSESAGQDLDPNEDGAAAECFGNSDCTAAGPSCCTCPTYALPTASGWDDSCEDVCESPSTCSTEAACDTGTGACVLQCKEVQCDGAVTCENGFVVDATGCLSCECAGAAPPDLAECVADSDCVEVAEDCCGCARGGADTAVPSSEVDSFTSGLGCDTSPACPGVDVCDADLVPRCLAGSCQLGAPPNGTGLTPDAGPGGVPTQQLCGTSELPACPDGEYCVLNSMDAEDATMGGLGVCQPS